MRTTSTHWMAIVFLAAVSGASGHAAEALAQGVAAENLLYRPPLRGAPAKRVGGATRGMVETRSPITLVAPTHTGLTISEQPALYWYMEQPSAGRMVLRLIALDTAATVAEKALPESACAGFYRINLASEGVTLKPELNYRWQIAVFPADPQTSYATASATIRYTNMVAPNELSARPSAERRRVLAEAGIWYDVVDELMTQLKLPDPASNPRGTLGGLLGQVDIMDSLAKGPICY